MATSRRAIVKALRRAERKQYPVEIDRGEESWANWVNGYVVGVGEQWVVLQSLREAVHIDGYNLIRTADINGVEADREAGYVERAVAGLGGRPEVDFRLPGTAGIKDVLQAAADHANLICVYLEAEDDSPRLIGHLGRLGPRKFEMQLINPRGVWTDEPSRWRYKDVTSVSFGGRYEAALERFGERDPIFGPTVLTNSA